MTSPYRVVRDFELAIADYTGSPYAVAVNSCTMALFLCCRFLNVGKVFLPSRTYISVPMSVIHAGGQVEFENYGWRGMYQLSPYPIWDAARRFTSGMYRRGQYQCLSFQAAKILAIEQGGCILHDNEVADRWFRRARFDGRSEGVPPKDDDFKMLGWHAYMSPSVASQGLLRLYSMPKHNEDLLNDDYPDLSQLEIFS